MEPFVVFLMVQEVMSCTGWLIVVVVLVNSTTILPASLLIFRRVLFAVQTLGFAVFSLLFSTSSFVQHFAPNCVLAGDR